MRIFKLFRSTEWHDLCRDGETPGAPVDLADGYIHFSTAETVQATRDKHFAGEDGLWLISCEDARFGDELRWEVSRGGLLFPHLYRVLRMADVTEARALPEGPIPAHYLGGEAQ
ncbi:MAG: DUF952 domain-containing protein [Paracoccus sp. (in: a-proteobacteria)]|nr:DUF952 domain-containing protein [Paracoccus sp. (in: a-proteobacteria)]